MAAEPPAQDLDARESQLSTELDMLTDLAGLAVQSGRMGAVQDSLRQLSFRQGEAKSLAEAGRPAQSERLAATIADLADALKTMGGTAAMLQEATMADTKAESEARAEREGVWQETLDEGSAAAQDRAREGRKLL